MQRISATSIGTSIPLLYPDAMIFPSIFWKSIDSNGSIAGALPASLLSENITQYGFESIPQHVRSRLTSSSSTTATDPRYASFSYDSLINLACTHSDTRIAVHRGLATDESGELRLRGRSDTALQSSLIVDKWLKIHTVHANIIIFLILSLSLAIRRNISVHQK